MFNLASRAMRLVQRLERRNASEPTPAQSPEVMTTIADLITQQGKGAGYKGQGKWGKWIDMPPVRKVKDGKSW